MVHKFLMESSDVIKEYELYNRGENHIHVILTVYNPADLQIVKDQINKMLGRKSRPVNLSEN